MQHIIRLIGEINDENFETFSRRLRKFEIGNIKSVKLELMSEGGDAYSALAFFDRIKNSSIELHVEATGLVASAAVLVFMACKNRSMTDNAWLMVHEDSLSGLDDQMVHKIEKEARHARRMEEQWCDILSSVSSVDKKIWTKLHRRETYLTKKECEALGILTKGVK